MTSLIWYRKLLIISVLVMLALGASANNQTLFKEARTMQREGKFDEAITAFKSYLTQPIDKNDLVGETLVMYTDALVQLMNTYQSKGEPEACITTLRELFNASPLLQNQCLRDFYSVMGYALSRTENMDEAEETMLKTFSIPLYEATPERYFRDYAYAAAVFYSNPDYQKDVINWCHEALQQAQLSKNSSGKQWVTAMLGSIYKRYGYLNHALELFQESKVVAQSNNDDLGVLNSLHALSDLFLYWDIPEYANIYATEAVAVDERMTEKNPMVSAQTYIIKGRTLHRLGISDSVSVYTEKARMLCQALPYNSGMVDIDLLDGTCLTEHAGDSLNLGVQILLDVTRQGTPANQAKAYHQLALTYLRDGKIKKAETMLDNLYSLLNHGEYSPNYIRLDYDKIINHYLENGKHDKAENYTRLMLQEENAFKQDHLNYNLVESIVDLQTGINEQQLEIMRLNQANNRLWFTIYVALSVIVIFLVIAILFYQNRRHLVQMKQADEKVAILIEKLNQSNLEKENAAQEIQDFLKNKENRQELETLTPFILKENGESKFRECFELLYPLFLHRLRERVPSVTRREELLSMLIVLKQENKKIAELMGIETRSVLMLRHRFRQKIGMDTEYSLENFIEEILDPR